VGLSYGLKAAEPQDGQKAGVNQVSVLSRADQSRREAPGCLGVIGRLFAPAPIRLSNARPDLSGGW